MVLFLIVRSDQEINKTLALFASSRFNNFYRPFALLTQAAKHAKKDIVTAGWRRSQLA